MDTPFTFLGVEVFIFLLSLQSFYFYTLGVAPIPYLALAAALFRYYLVDRRGVNKLALSLFLFLVVLAGCYVIVLHFFRLEQSLKTYLGFSFSLSAVLLYAWYSDKSGLERALLFFLSLHAVAFYLQLGGLLLGYHIDYMAWLTGESQRTGTGVFYIYGWKLHRPTGLFNEPGTFATFYLPVLAIWLVLKDDKIKAFEWFFLFAPLLTFSVAGLLMWFVSVLPLLFLRRRQLFVSARIGMLLGFVLLVVLVPHMYRYAISSLDGKLGVGESYESERAGTRVEFMEKEIYGAFPSLLMFGSGFPLDIGDSATGKHWQRNAQGLLVHWVWTFGGFFVFLLFLIYLSAGRFSLVHLMPLLALVGTKLQISYPFVIFLFVIIFYSSRNRFS